MALKRADLRKILEAENTTDEKIGEVLNLLHTETDVLQNALEEANAKLAAAEKDRDTANSGKEAAEKALKDFKDEQTAKDTRAAKAAKAKALLKQAGVLEKYIDDIVNDSKKGDEFVNALELDEKGEVKDTDKALERAKTDFSGKIGKVTVTGAKEVNPPTNTVSKLSKTDIINIKDTAERQAAIRANPALFIGGERT